MSSLVGRFRWIVRRRGNRVGPLDASDRAAFRAIGVILLAVVAAAIAWYAHDFDFAAYSTFRGELRTARGTVTAIERTGVHEPGTRWSRRDERTEIVGVRYTFADPGGVTRDGVSYRPGARLQPGASVTVEYPVGRPDVSRIRGYRGAKFDSMPAALLIMIAVGAGLLLVGLMGERGRRRHPPADADPRSAWPVA